MNLKIIQKRNIFFIFSSILAVASVLVLFFWGLHFSIDFTGGSLLEVTVAKEYMISAQELASKIQSSLPDIGEVRVQPVGETGYIIRMKDLSEQEHQEVLSSLTKIFNEKSKPIENKTVTVEERRFESVGPLIGEELKNKAIWAIGLAVVLMVVYIAWAFRKVSKPVASWKYGLGAIIALIHDILIVTGIFAILSHFFIGYEIDLLFVTALMTILGYSVNDTIVVYDRIRENLIYNPQPTFEATINKSLNETMTRSLNTGLATMFVLVVLYFFGGVTIKNFSLTLLIGIVFGTYSSIFVASALLMVWYRLGLKR